MSDLTDALDELIAAHAKIGSPLPRTLRPGRDRAEVQEALSKFGLVPPDEVVEWFGWHEYDRDAWQAAGGRSSPELFWFGWAMSLDEAVRTYREYEQDVDPYSDPQNPIPDEEQWRTTWFPVLWSSPGDFVVECDDATADRGHIRRVENQPIVPQGPAAPVIFPTLAEFVGAAVRSVRDHSWWEQGTIQIDDETDGRIEHF